MSVLSWRRMKLLAFTPPITIPHATTRAANQSGRMRVGVSRAYSTGSACSRPNLKISCHCSSVEHSSLALPQRSARWPHPFSTTARSDRRRLLVSPTKQRAQTVRPVWNVQQAAACLGARNAPCAALVPPTCFAPAACTMIASMPKLRRQIRQRPGHQWHCNDRPCTCDER